MTLFKLSLRNVRKSIKDYMIYFVTLVIGVAVFYVFNAIGDQAVLLQVSSSTLEIIDLMTAMLSVFSVLVSFVLGFLVVYASSFLLKRRKKEFGLYFLLGMGKRQVSMILLGETILIGFFSMMAGLAIGIVASQGMSIVVANMFEADMTQFHFTVSRAAVLKTIVYFIIMYGVVLLLDTIVVGKSKLIDLLNAGKKSEFKKGRNPLLCLLLFVASAVLLGTAYYQVTANAEAIVSETQLLREVVKGIIGTFLLFWSLSGLLLFLERHSKRLKYGGLNVFTIKELSSRINTTVFSGGMICLLLFVTICVFSSAMSIKESLNNNLKEMTPVDVNFDKCYGENDQKDIETIFQENGVDLSLFEHTLTLNSYSNEAFTMRYTLGDAWQNLNLEQSIRDWYASLQEEAIHVSDYNQVAKLYGLKTWSLKDDEYMILCDFDTMSEIRNKALKIGTILTVGGKNYAPKYQECQDGFLEIASNHVNMGIILLPDSADFSEMSCYENYFIADYRVTEDRSKQEIEEYLQGPEFQKILAPDDQNHIKIGIDTKIRIYENSIGLTAMIVFLGVYLGVVFLISSAALLALKELSEASDNRAKYQILRRIGANEKSLRRSLFVQCAIVFGLPLFVAIIHSIFGIQVCAFILDTFGNTGLLTSILITAAVIVAVYGVYFLITYVCSRKIIEEN